METEVCLPRILCSEGLVEKNIEIQFSFVFVETLPSPKPSISFCMKTILLTHLFSDLMKKSLLLPFDVLIFKQCKPINFQIASTYYYRSCAS